jgi:hypothetical protein
MVKPSGALFFKVPAAATKNDWYWFDALGQLDVDGNKKPLTDLLRSERELPPTSRKMLADLIERGVPAPNNRPPTPAYTMSETEQLHCSAHRDVKALVQGNLPWPYQGPLEGKMPLQEALNMVASKYNLNPSTLASSYKRGKRRSK